MTNQQKIAEFINQHHNEIEGWFYPQDMLLFTIIDTNQKNHDTKGDMCEVGVYKGKSLILLSLLSNKSEKVYAYDLFFDDLLESTKVNMENYGITDETGEIEYIVGDSSQYSVSELNQTISKPLRVLHIDAGHEYHEVLHSLYSFAPFVANDGVIIMDDYQDRNFPGIEAAVNKFSQEFYPRRFVPFLAGGNKMYLCRPEYAGRYIHSVIQNPSFENRCRISTIEDYFVLVILSSVPMSNEQVTSILNHQFTPYEYDVNMDYLKHRAKNFGQHQKMFLDKVNQRGE